MTQKRNRYLVLLITVVAFAAIALIGTLVPEETLQSWIATAGPYGPIAFIFLDLIAFVIAPLNSTPILFAGFYAFGPTVVWYASVAGILASIINFSIARRWGRLFVVKIVGEENMRTVNRFTNRYGLAALFVSRMFLTGLHDVISYASGLTDLKFWPYFIVSTLAGLPATFLWYYVAKQTGSPTVFVGITVAMVIVFSLLLSMGLAVWKALKNRHR